MATSIERLREIAQRAEKFQRDVRTHQVDNRVVHVNGVDGHLRVLYSLVGSLADAVADIGDKDVRFYLQDPHIDGLAVIDREISSLVISSFGDTSDEARAKLMTVVNALNAAVDPRVNSLHRADVFKQVEPVLAWRVMEHLSEILLFPHP